MIETAVSDGDPDGFEPADVADLDFDGDARAEALDLSLADARFAPDVLEASARRAVEAWAEAVDGDDTELARLASTEALQQLLYHDAAEKIQVVVREPRVQRIAIVALDASREPATMAIEVELQGQRYVEDRDTKAVMSGSRDEATAFTERWTLSLDGAGSSPWQITAVRPLTRESRHLAERLAMSPAPAGAACGRWAPLGGRDGVEPRCCSLSSPAR